MPKLLEFFCWVTLFLSAASATDSSSASIDDQKKPTSDSRNLLKPSNKSEFTSVTSSRIDKLVENDVSNSDPDKDLTLDELLLFESLIDSERLSREESESTTVNSQDDNHKNYDINGISATPIVSKVTLGSIRRQGDLSPVFEGKQPDSSAQFDDSKEDPPLRFGQRFSSPNNRARDGAPLLHLTQGGYQRPYQQPARFRPRQTTRPESSEQSEKVQEPGESPSNNNNRPPPPRRIVPQVTYSSLSSQQEQSYPFRTSPILRPAFNIPLDNRVVANQVAPTAIQNGLFNAPQSNFLDYRTPTFRAQYPPNNEIAFSSFSRNPNSAPLHPTSLGNPFQNTGLLFQRVPQVQPQPILIDPSRNLQLQFPYGNLPTYPNFESTEDVSRVNIASYFNDPAVNTFQAPPNFYSANPNEGINVFNSQPINFIPNYPNADQRFPPEFFRNTVAARDQQNVNDQQPASDTSQEDKKAKEIESKEDNGSTNNEEPASVRFGTRLQPQNGDNVFIRYPTNEAGYAVEENMPSANGSNEVKENFGMSIADQRNFPTGDPYRNALNTLRSQRQNKTHRFIPEELFRDVPIDFGYQRPQTQIFMEYPDRDISRFTTPDLDTRGPLNRITSLSESDYPFLNAVNKRRDGQNLNSMPLCAKPNNATFCFEDEEYPRNDILYSVNSNTYLMDRLSGPDLKLDQEAYVERNVSGALESQENYACSTDIKYGTPLRGKNLDGSWRVIVNLQRFAQPVRMEVCRSMGDPCSYTDSTVKTTCVQKYSIQRLLTWSQDRGIFTDSFKIPVACSCQILQVAEA